MSVILPALQQQPASPEELADPALVQIRELLYRVSGIYQMDFQFSFLVSRCRRRMKILNLTSFADYVRQLAAPATRDGEIRKLLNEITIGETYFFRNQAQIDALTKIILPRIAATDSRPEQKKLRIWSAGCSTGEEPYTLAIALLEETSRHLKGWRFEIVATDLNDHSMQKCAQGLYNDYAVRNVRAELKNRYFCQDGPSFRINDAARALIKVVRINLEDQPRIVSLGGFDIIFCCNVLIYFDSASKTRAVANLYQSLHPGGYLFLGDCESLYHIEHHFRLMHYPGAAAYRKPMLGEVPGDAI